MAAFPELQVWDRYESAPAAFAASARLSGKLDWGDRSFCDKVALIVSGISTKQSVLAGLERLKAAVSGEGLDNSDGLFNEALDAFFGASRASEEAA